MLPLIEPPRLILEDLWVLLPHMVDELLLCLYSLLLLVLHHRLPQHTREGRPSTMPTGWALSS
jgi:hypothetical protein